MSKLKNRINVIVMTSVGIALLLVGLFYNYKMNEFYREALTASGTVVDLYETNSGTYAPIVEYTNSKGEKRSFTSSSSGNPPNYSIGEEVEVLYIYSNNKVMFDEYIYNEFDVFIRKYGVIIFGLFFIALSIPTALVFWNRESMHVSIEFKT